MRGKSAIQQILKRCGEGASMRPAHYAREVPANIRGACGWMEASMRPAHYAREVHTAGGGPSPQKSCFNEARALCAGSLPPANTRMHGDLASMRPAHYAREVIVGTKEPLHDQLASMRPAHYAREVGVSAKQGVHALAASMRPAHYAREVRQADALGLERTRLQ